MPAHDDYRNHPQYIGDARGLFGAPPGLICQYCQKPDYELFYGHCRSCARAKNVPMKTASNQKINEVLSAGSTIIIEGIPDSWRDPVNYILLDPY